MKITNKKQKNKYVHSKIFINKNPIFFHNLIMCNYCYIRTTKTLSEIHNVQYQFVLFITAVS